MIRIRFKETIVIFIWVIKIKREGKEETEKLNDMYTDKIDNCIMVFTRFYHLQAV